MYEILKDINSPDDVKKLNMEELKVLANDIRDGLFNRLTKIGGHFGPNFGIVETEIAMHYVFNSPEDKFIFDVSHQSYPHKMLTGRKAGYIDDTHFKEDSGYTNPEESKHDFFNVGHTSTSISLATGLAKARDLLGKKENIIALIGDGSLSGGEALEGLNVAGSELNSNLIIIVNDNQQSISETHGGIYKNLKELRETKGKATNNMFKAIGLDYIYEENGNDIESMIKVFEKVKGIIVEQLGVADTAVTLEASFIDDLGADSLDIVELVMALEEEFDIEIPDADAEKVVTVGDVVDYIKENV